MVQDLALVCGLPGQGQGHPALLTAQPHLSPTPSETRQPGPCPEDTFSRFLLGTEQARTSPPGLPGAHPISATGQNPEMAVPTPLPPTLQQSRACLLRSGAFTQDPGRGRDRDVLGKLLMSGTHPGLEGPDTRLNPIPGATQDEA